MELRHLRYFVAVVEERSFSRAAERLHIAQPPLSQQIRRLEADLGFPLLERTSKGVRPTRAGEALLTGARAVLQAAEEARKAAAAAHAGVTGRLSIAYVNSAAYAVLPRLMRLIRDAQPGLRVDAREMAIADQIDALVDGRVDVGILRPPVDDPRLDSMQLLQEPFVVALPSRHRLARRRTLAPAQLEGEPLIGYPPGHPAGFRERIDAVLRAAGVTARYAQEATYVHSLCGLVAGGAGISVVPDSARSLGIDGVLFVPLQAPDLYAELWLAWHSRPLQIPVQNLVALARIAFRS